MNSLLEACIDVSCLDASGQRKQILRDFALTLRQGEIFSLAGQSGSGKSTFALSALGLLPRPAFTVKGRMLFQGNDILTKPEREWRHLRGRHIGLVPQSPLAALNPRLRLGTMFCEAWQAHAGRGGDWRAEARAALSAVELPSNEEFLARYPKQLSVGMAQRVLIAMAVLHRPELLIADEATSALDLITQAEVLELFRRLNQRHGTTLLFITHDLAAAASLCHRAGVLHEGRLVECGTVDEVFRRPRHEYTRRLLRALPQPVLLEDLGQDAGDLEDGAVVDTAGRGLHAR
jgi:ABC-type dipeptide/oligopeptide/nickel transport system ATPase component